MRITVERTNFRSILIVISLNKTFVEIAEKLSYVVTGTSIYLFFPSLGVISSFLLYDIVFDRISSSLAFVFTFLFTILYASDRIYRCVPLSFLWSVM